PSAPWPTPSLPNLPSPVSKSRSSVPASSPATSAASTTKARSMNPPRNPSPLGWLCPQTRPSATYSVQSHAANAKLSSQDMANFSLPSNVSPRGSSASPVAESPPTAAAIAPNRNPPSSTGFSLCSWVLTAQGVLVTHPQLCSLAPISVLM